MIPLVLEEARAVVRAHVNLDPIDLLGGRVVLQVEGDLVVDERRRLVFRPIALVSDAIHWKTGTLDW